MTDNLTGSERAALKSLSDDKSIIIHNADEGGIVVVLDSDVYKNEALRHFVEP